MTKNGIQIERYILPYVKDLASNSLLKTDKYCFIGFNKQIQKYEIEEFRQIDIKSLKKKIIKEIIKQKENIAKTAYNNIPSTIDKEKILIKIDKDFRSEIFIEENNDTVLVKSRLFHADIMDKRKIPAGLTLFSYTIVNFPKNEITGSYLDWEVAWYD